jgi:hypothetical protein
MTDRNKAFLNIASLGAAGDGTHNGVVQAFGVILAPDNSVLPNASCSVVFGYSDSSEGIRVALADNLRENTFDPDLIVIFLDSPGRY